MKIVGCKACWPTRKVLDKTKLVDKYKYSQHVLHELNMDTNNQIAHIDQANLPPPRKFVRRLGKHDPPSPEVLERKQRDLAFIASCKRAAGRELIQFEPAKWDEQNNICRKLQTLIHAG